ncbi:MAG: flagellar brake protein [Gammaproteobacteria bacterium]
MLGWLRKILGTNKDHSEQETNNTPFKDNFSTSKEFNLKVLNNLQDQHASLVIHFPQHSEQYVSMILEINPEKNRIMLDEFVPREGHEKAISGEVFRVSTSHHGVAIIFRTKVIEHGFHDSIPYYIAEIPEEIEYRQCRDSFRLLLPSSSHFIAKLSRENLKLEGLIQDLSFSGMGLVLKNKLPADSNLQRLDVFEECVIYDAHHKPIILKFEIRRIIIDEQNNKTILGGKFVQIDKPTQKLINNMVATLQREQRRKENRMN